MVRELDDKYGRSITKVRHALTDEDRNPLPTVTREHRSSAKEAISDGDGSGYDGATVKSPAPEEDEEKVGKSP
jgi:ribosomal protein S12 methylthiotransferase accessory factor YcaO